MKQMKRWLRITATALAVLLFVSACSKTNIPKQPDEVIENKDAVKFDAEYTSLNGKTNDSGVKYLDMEIGENNPFTYSSFAEINEVIRNGTGVILFGFPECPWCRNAIPVLNDVAEQENIKQIYYLNVRELRDVKKLDASGKVVTEKEGAEGYAELLELLYDHIDDYEGLNDPTIKRLYVPAVVFVKNGEVQLYHVSTVESQTDPYVPLTKEQYQELYDIYADATVRTLRDVCDTSATGC